MMELTNTSYMQTGLQKRHWKPSMGYIVVGMPFHWQLSFTTPINGPSSTPGAWQMLPGTGRKERYLEVS